jgi:hypothetical protein
MLYDLRETYIRRDRRDVKRPVFEVLTAVGISLAALLASCALLFASLKFGLAPGSEVLSTIYLP